MDTLPSDEDSIKGTRDWPHAPPHRLEQAGVYFVTARTRDATHLFDTPERRDWLQELLLTGFEKTGWKLEAWAVLSNHYHVVAHSPSGSAETLGHLLQKLHSLSTKRLNQEDGTPGRTRLWQNYRETHLTYQRSYLARLNYVHQNPRHHGLVTLASQWPWCSAADFKATASPAWVQTIASFQFDKIAAEDGTVSELAMHVSRHRRQQGWLGESGSRLPQSKGVAVVMATDHVEGEVSGVLRRCTTCL